MISLVINLALVAEKFFQVGAAIILFNVFVCMLLPAHLVTQEHHIKGLIPL